MLSCVTSATVVLFIVFYCLKTVISDCRHSYLTVCDTFEDFKNYKDVDSISELMIGSEKGTNMTSVDLMKTLFLDRCHKLTTLKIIRALNKLENTQYAYLCFYSNSPLQYFILYGNILQTIDSNHFPVVPLKRMSLVNNQIEFVKPWAFRSHEIENLDLSDNLLEAIESESLPLKNASKVITIRNNRLSHIDPGSFSPSLETLNLDNNKLRYIQDEVLEDLVNLKELTLSHNNFNVFPKIDHLTQLVIFDISHNKITTFKKGIFEKMDKLRFVDLSNNQITSDLVLEWISIPNKQPTLTVSLALNRLRNVNLDNVGKASLQNQTFVLYGNPWDCNRWPKVKTALSGHESKCDVEFLSSGSVPYCINYLSGSYPFDGLWDQEIDTFHKTVKESEKKAGCILAPNRHEWLHHINVGCVA